MPKLDSEAHTFPTDTKLAWFLSQLRHP